MQPAPTIHFDGWTFSGGELLRGTVKIRLQRKTRLILLELLAHPGELVKRDAMIARAWPEGVVDGDTALNSAMRRLRKVLEDDADAPRYIQTIPRRGYRFIAEVTTVAVAAPAMPPPARPRRWWWVAMWLIATGVRAAFMGGEAPR